MGTRRGWIPAALVLHTLLHSAFAQSNDRIPVLIDTDLGTGVEDPFALLLAFGSEELDVRGITTVGDDTHKRAMMMCRFLTVTGRRHTRVAAGAKPQPPRPITNQSKYYYHPDPLFNRTTKPEKQTAADFMHDRAKQRPGALTVVALGPLTNVAQMINAHSDASKLIRRIVLLEANVSLDIDAARTVFASGIPLIVLASDACRGCKLDDAAVKKVFSPGTPLTRQAETLYQMWDGSDPSLGEALAVALCFDERFATLETSSLVVDDEGRLEPRNATPNSRVVGSSKSDDFAAWYVKRIASLVAPERRPSRVIHDDRMPNRVHVAEDFDTDIERFWWMSGKPETRLLPPGSRRACRGVLTHDFDDLLMVSRQMYSAVIFNPVPGPPMGENTRLRFRYWLRGTDRIRVQIYSLTNGYHRHLVIKGLPQKEWQVATVDMTEARRPDGTGGPLSEDERIDDIQFYIDPNAEIVVDDIVLYDAASDSDKKSRPFPKRIIFAGTFDTGKRGEHWPGEFELVRDAGNFWRALRTVENPESGAPWIRMGLRGQRALGESASVSFRYRLSGTDEFRIRLVNHTNGHSRESTMQGLKQDEWARARADFTTEGLSSIDEIHILLQKGSQLLLDDLIVFQSGS